MNPRTLLHSAIDTTVIPIVVSVRALQMGTDFFRDIGIDLPGLARTVAEDLVRYTRVYGEAACQGAGRVVTKPYRVARDIRTWTIKASFPTSIYYPSNCGSGPRTTQE